MFVKQDEGARQNELRALWQEAFPEDSEAYLDYLFAHKYRPEFCRLLLKGEELAAALHVLPLSFSLCGRALELPFYYGVATLQKFRYQGCAKTLLRASLYELREKGIQAAALYPFHYGFYRKMGFGLLNTCAAFEIPASSLAALGAHSEAGEATPEGMLAAFSAMVARFEAAPLRTLERCAGRLAEWKSDGGSTLAVPGGYALFALEEERADIEELVYTDGRALRALLTKLGEVARTTGCKVVSGTLPEGEFPHAWFGDSRAMACADPGAMVRPVDLPALLEGCETELTEPLALEIVDEFLPENSGVWRMVPNGGRIALERGGKADALCPVETLAGLLFGGQEARAALALGELRPASEGAAKALLRAFPKRSSLFFDRY